jgi:hypothetical protein
MSTIAYPLSQSVEHPVDVRVEPVLENRNRLTTFFRVILALPHLFLVGLPIAVAPTFTWAFHGALGSEAGLGPGALGAAAGVGAMVAWFSILFTGDHPKGIRTLATMYLRWRVWALAYVTMLRDEYPPFGEGDYPIRLELGDAPQERDRMAVGFRIILAIPHILIVWALSVAWFLTTLLAWASIVLTGSFPRTLYDFGVGVLRWNTRVEAYLLLLHDEYPPFSFG